MSEVQRKIIHVDMDCFFAAVELLDNPELKGKPLIVGGTSNRGVVCAASYEAREYGVHSAMPLFRAKELCPMGTYLPVRMSRYVEISKKIRNVFLSYTDLVQPISLDEAFLDVTRNKKNMVYASKIASEIRRRIFQEIGITASAGVAANKFLAKIASDIKKPNGLTVIPPEKVEAFMQTLPIEKIWGVGRVTAKKLRDLGIRQAGEISTFPQDFLIKKFGKFGSHLIELSQGIDHSQVIPSRGSKSIGRERTFESDMLDFEKLQDKIESLLPSVMDSLSKKKLLAKTLTIKIKYKDFKQVTRSQSLEFPSEEEDSFKSLIPHLLKKTEAGTQPIRLVGLSLSNLSPRDQRKALDLFDVL